MDFSASGTATDIDRMRNVNSPNAVTQSEVVEFEDTGESKWTP